MTGALYAVGLGNVLTASALCGLRRSSRLLLAAGGLAGIGVAVFPQPHSGSSALHIGCAAASIVILAIWPATVRVDEPTTSPTDGLSTALTDGHARSTLLSKPLSLFVAAALLGLDTWLFAAGHGSGQLGVAERVATGAENVWPLAVVVALRREPARMHG